MAKRKSKRKRTEEERIADNAAKRRRWAAITPDERLKYNHRRRVERRKRYVSDEAYRKNVLDRKNAWNAAKRTRCPEYGKLATLRSTVGRIRESIAHHQDLIDKWEKRLFRLTKQIVDLAERCKGR